MMMMNTSLSSDTIRGHTVLGVRRAINLIAFSETSLVFVSINGIYGKNLCYILTLKPFKIEY
jgi:hypothetical protein